MSLRCRTDIINYLIKTLNFENYLEIGINNPHANFNRIIVKNKTSVDPYIPSKWDDNNENNISGWLQYCTHRMTSDEFFSQNTEIYDLIFIDGLHEEAQVDKDIYNALKVLKRNGIIIVHDCIPIDEYAQQVPRTVGGWNGDVWKSFVKISQLKNPKLKTYVANFDHGCGIIVKLDEINYKIPKPLSISYQEFSKNMDSIYNIVDSDFIMQLPNEINNYN